MTGTSDAVQQGEVKASGTLESVTRLMEQKRIPGFGHGLRCDRVFTAGGDFDWSKVDTFEAVIKDESGKTVFVQKGVTAPKGWSQLAVDVTASKYFRGALGSPERESSVRQLITRVVGAIAKQATEAAYFRDAEHLEAFKAELTYILATQRAAFNSPVWFNLGVAGVKQQASACFILKAKDSLADIMRLATTEAMIFKGGSGSGVDLSPIRGATEPLNGGGIASGALSWMVGLDEFAGGIKSGGKTRRAAKMVVLKDRHPDVLAFIRCKAVEEKKAHALVEMGYDPSFDADMVRGAYKSVKYQNANNSVRASDAFMQAVKDDGPWSTYLVTDPSKVAQTYKARELFREIAEAAHLCGDPGLQFDGIINGWHTCKATGAINASNPCSEFVFLDDTSCNLASLNLLQFFPTGELTEQGLAELGHAVRILLVAMEIIVGLADYPTPEITANSYAYRPLGLGYANLGALLMRAGLAYDSDAGRDMAAVVTAFIGGEAQLCSSAIARYCGGPFAGYELNRASMLGVVERHTKAAQALDDRLRGTKLAKASLVASALWAEALVEGLEHGYRNAQVTLIAPTGTIAFMMDCDTTGVEPDLALVKYKKLVGGGVFKLANLSVEPALIKLGYTPEQVKAILAYLTEHDTIEGAPGLKSEHLPVFDCAFKPQKGKRSIPPEGHVRMLGAVQPYLSGAISKTVNMPSTATVEDFERVFMLAYDLGVKCVALYRDGCKLTQPLSTAKVAEKAKARTAPTEVPTPPTPGPQRRRLPDERASITHKFSIAGNEGYMTVGMYDDGTPGELFIRMSKEGSTLSGLLDAFATMVSIGLQFGVPLRVITDKFSHTRFEPSGYTNSTDPKLKIAKSIIDYVARYIDTKFGAGLVGVDAAKPKAERTVVAVVNPAGQVATQAEVHAGPAGVVRQLDAPLCGNCHEPTTRKGACYVCDTCGTTTGCG